MGACIVFVIIYSELAYGARVTGYFTAVINLHILEAVCSTSSKPVFGACKTV